MDPEFSSCSSSTIDSIRRAGIGRRGGVKVRGGRLPPVQIQNVIARKKVVAPKIPQRRVKINQESNCDANTFEQPYSNFEGKFQRSRGRGHGRGTKTYIQTEGTLLGDGPALRIKKEREYTSYDRISVPRSSKNSVCDVKIEQSVIEHLLESYEETGLYEDCEYDLMPIKYPCRKPRIKKEIKQDFDSEDIKPFIKVEPEELPTKTKQTYLEGKFFTRIKNESHPVVNDFVEVVKKTEEGKSIMFLLQFPNRLPYEILPDTENEKDKKKTSRTKVNADNEKQEKDENSKTTLRNIPEGHLGKLQVLKSGKMRLVIGSIHIALESGITPQHLCEVVSMPVEDNGGNVIVLGRIERKMILKPHVTHGYV